MTFMMTSSNDDKSDICQFFDQDLFHIINTVCTKFHVKWTKLFWDTACFFTGPPGLLGPPLALRFSKKPSPGKVNNYIKLCWYQIISSWNMKVGVKLTQWWQLWRLMSKTKKDSLAVFFYQLHFQFGFGGGVFI